MRKLIVAAVMVMGVAAVTMAAQEKKFGSALTLTEITKVSDIYANPEKYSGKRVQVQGPIVDVCEMMGCWLALGSDKEFETIRFKVEDGVIVFPMSIKGKNAKVEGIISVETLSVAQQIAQGEEHAKEQKTTFDPKTIKGPKVGIQIKGEGAIVF
ncbi:MAG: DUF4920 domain-containing protein [Acidobacteria bacterium]|jgi:hypothetical protein|nr:DUF4920 domain-containing protein [Acidobacteriota bacterium]